MPGCLSHSSQSHIPYRPQIQVSIGGCFFQRHAPAFPAMFLNHKFLLILDIDHQQCGFFCQCDTHRYFPSYGSITYFSSFAGQRAGQGDSSADSEGKRCRGIRCVFLKVSVQQWGTAQKRSISADSFLLLINLAPMREILESGDNLQLKQRWSQSKADTPSKWDWDDLKVKLRRPVRFGPWLRPPNSAVIY